MRRSFFVGFGRSRVAVPFRRLVGFALAGGCVSWLLRDSSVSFTGSVVWAFFPSRDSAVDYALVVYDVVGFAVRVRPAWCSSVGYCWVVSVPCVV